MKLIALTLVTLAMLSLTLTPVDAARKHHRHHHMGSSSNSGSPNGTAGGPTSLSCTGSSQFGGSNPGTGGKN